MTLDDYAWIALEALIYYRYSVHALKHKNTTMELVINYLKFEKVNIDTFWNKPTYLFFSVSVFFLDHLTVL